MNFLSSKYSSAVSPHDLNLSAVGPYSRRFIGAVQILDAASGRMAACPLSVGVEGGTRVSGEPGPEGTLNWSMVDASADLDYFVYRYYLKEKDALHADAEYLAMGNKGFVCALTFRNRTETPAVFHASVQALREWQTPEVLRHLPRGAALVEAKDYLTTTAYHRYATDGERPCVRQMLFSSTGKALEGHFGEWPEDRVDYKIRLGRPIPNAAFFIRYAKVYDNIQPFILTFNGKQHPVEFGKTADRYGTLSGWKYLRVPLGRLKAGTHKFSLKVVKPQNEFGIKGYDRNLYAFPVNTDLQKRTEFGIDFFALADAGSDPAQWVVRKPEAPDWEYRTQGEIAQIQDPSLRRDRWFAFGASTPGSGFSSLLEKRGVTEVTEHHHRKLLPSGTKVLDEEAVTISSLCLELPAITVLPGNEETRYFAFLRAGTGKKATQELKSLLKKAPVLFRKQHLTHPRNRFPIHDEHFGPSIRHLMAYTLANVSYPHEVRGKLVRANCPAKFTFPVLYTWDEGMAAVAQSEYSLKRALECVRQYLIKDDPEQGFIQHGTALPTQIYAIWEAFQKTGDKNILKAFYPLLRNAYRFYVGTHSASTSMRNRNGLVNTSNLWYNALGMDDYPVQQYCAQNNLLARAGFPETNASAIRFAKLMRLMASIRGHRSDVAEYGRDIRNLQKAMNKLWDAECGYYSYEIDRKPLLFGGRVNYNKGLSGVYPLASGLENNEIRSRLVHHLGNPEEMWSPIGLSTVDQSAPYYSPDGYWNGRVWIAHQWVLWKALLDCGEVELAERIARTALEVYARAEKKTGHCFENFIIKTGEGAGTPHFSALSAPVACFYGALFVPGRLTTGFDVYTNRRRDDREGYPVSIELASPYTARHRTTLMLVLKPDSEYLVGTELVHTGPQGAVMVTLEIDKRKNVEIKPVFPDK